MSALLLALPLALLPQAKATRPAPAPEPTFTYDFIQVGYITTDLDLVDETSDGMSFLASYDITDHVNLVASYSFETLTVSGADLDTRAFTFGAGLHAPLHERIDIYGAAVFISSDAEALGVSGSETGFGVEAGFRTMPVDRVELVAAVVHTDVFESSTNFAAGARGYVTDSLSLGFDAVFDSDGNAYGINLRYGF